MKKIFKFLKKLILLILLFILQWYIFVWLACEVPTSGISKDIDGYNMSYKGKNLARTFSIIFLFTSIMMLWILNKFFKKG